MQVLAVVFPITVTGKVRKVEMREQPVPVALLDLGEAAAIRNA